LSAGRFHTEQQAGQCGRDDAGLACPAHEQILVAPNQLCGWVGRHTLPIALAGLAVITAYKLSFTGFKTGGGLSGLGLHLAHEWAILSNLFLLLMGFALLSRHFERSGLPDEMPAFLPDDWKGGLTLLAVVFVLSAFLDN
jgi:hypothetical protein